MNDQTEAAVQRSLDTPDALATDEWFPLTPMQEAYLVGQAGGYQINIPGIVYLVLDIGDVDLVALENAWQQVVARHPSLRTVFSIEKGQRVLTSVSRYQVGVFEGDDLTDVKRAFSLNRKSASSWPLFQCAISRGSRGRALLHLELNILIADGHSVQVILADFFECYRGRHKDLRLLKYTFKDYCQRLARLKIQNSPERVRELEAKIAQLIGPPGLPLQCHPSSVNQPELDRIESKLSADVWRQVKALAASKNVSSNVIFLTSYALTLARYSRRQKFNIGITIYRRPEWHEQINSIVGDFTGVVALQIEIKAGLTFEQQAEAIQRSLWTELSDYGPDSTVEMLKKSRSRGTADVSGLPIVFTGFLGQSREAGDWKLVDVYSQTPQVWLDHQVLEQSGAIIFSWDFIKNLWPEGTMQEMFENHSSRLNALAESSAWKKIDSLPLRESDLRVTTVNSEEGSLPIWNGGVEAVDPAVITATRTFSYRQLRARINSLQKQLVSKGARRGDRIAIVTHKGWEQVVAVLATTEAGLVYVPVAPDLPSSRIEYLVHTSEAKMALVQAENISSALIPPSCDRIVISDTDDHEKPVDRALPNANDLAYIIFTSGSTGTPKGVAMSHGAVRNTIADVTARFQIGRSDRILSLSSLSFDLSVYDIFGAAASGGAIVVPGDDEVREPASWVLLMERAGVTVWNTVPALMLMLVEYLESNAVSPPAALRLILLSGDRIPVTLPARIRALFPKAQIVSLGGATEAAIWSVFHRIENVDPSWTSIPYGKALGGQSIDVYNDNNDIVPNWVVGEICIGGRGLANGYWGDTQRTRDAFISIGNESRLYRTGDLGRRWPDGTIEFLGREDGQVKVNGYRIELGEIEVALQGLNKISQSCAVLRDRQLVAYVVMEQGHTFDESEQVSLLRKRLPSYLIPQRIFQLSEIPLNANGKVDRNALPVTDEKPHPKRERSVDLENVVLELAAQIIGCARPTLGDDFFRLGGTSIQLIRFHQRVNQLLQIECPLSELIADTQLIGMAQSVAKNMHTEKKAKGPAFEVGTPLERPFPMMPLQQAYWVGRRNDIDLGGVAPHGYLEYEAREFDVARAQKAWNGLVQRHPALRTIFTDDGQQLVLPTVPAVEIAIKDFRGLPQDQQDTGRQIERQRLSHQVFQPDTWPLFELVATKTDGSVRWHVSIDLLVGDAWSLRILGREFAELYNNPHKTLPPLAVTYRDWVMWRQALVASPIREESQKYWLSKWQRLPPAPRLLLKNTDDETLPSVARCKHTLPRDSWSNLQSFAAEKRLTAVAVLITAFGVALREGGAGDKFLLNVTYFDRKDVHPDLSEIVGDFTASLLLPFEWRPHFGIAAAAASVHRELFEVMQHIEVSGVEVIRLAAANKKTITAPVVFTSIIGVPGLADQQKIEFPATEVYSISQTPQVWLDCQVSEQDGNLLVVWDYRADVLDGKYVNDLFKIFIEKIEALAVGDHGHEENAVASPFNELPLDKNKKQYMLMYRDRPAMRRESEGGVILSHGSYGAHPASARKSVRAFDLTPMPLIKLGGFLSGIAGISDSDRFVPKRGYASAGSLYPVQAYVVVRSNGVDGVEQGTYFYNPDEHRLIRTGDAPEFEAPAGFSFTLALMLIGCMPAIEPIYEKRALHFSLIEAGLIAQTLESWGRECGIGTCQVGWEPKFDWRKSARVDSNHQYLHTILFGNLPAESKISFSTPSEKQGHTSQSPDAPAPRVEAPQIATDQLRSTLFQVLQEVFDGSLRDMDTSLYYIGGDSVRAVRACVKASKLLGFEVPLRDLLENPTARGWAEALAKRMAKRNQNVPTAPKH